LCLAVLPAQGGSCPWHGGLGDELPFAMRRPSHLMQNRPVSDQYTVSVRMVDQLRGSEKSYIMEAESLTLPTVAGFSCEINAAANHEGLFAISCQKGTRTETMTHDCRKSGTEATTWRGMNADGMNTLTLMVYCEAVI
jgi:hypothetical protein